MSQAAIANLSDGAQRMTVGEGIAAFLESCGVRVAFGVISIHNMPILDAFGRRAEEAAARGNPAPIRFVPARGEAGAANMADAYARVSGKLGVFVTSTGTAAGNACGAMVEALTAGTPLLHLTGQIELPYIDRQLGYIHEAHSQLDMLKAVSKSAFRVRSPETALGTIREAVRVATTAPTGPVSVEIPIDIQATPIDGVGVMAPAPVAIAQPDIAELDHLVERLAKARRSLLWLGGGARGAGEPVRRLLDLGFGVVTSVQGRGIIAEDDPRTLGAFNLQQGVEKFYATCDAMVVVGSRLRSNETLKYQLKLPQPLYRIDADPAQQGRCYADAGFIAADSTMTLSLLADRLQGRYKSDPAFAGDLARVRLEAEASVRHGLGPYAALVTEIQRAAGRDFVWVRDVTVSNSTWGNRSLLIFGPRDGVHALGGGIGQGIQMAVGAALAAPKRKVFCLVGDGGIQVNLGELATLAQERANVTVILMNDRGYGVIRNIQDAHYGGRRYYVDLHTPDFAALAASVGLPHHRISDLRDCENLRAALAADGPRMIEIDMLSVGPFRESFAGPPVRKVAG